MRIVDLEDRTKPVFCQCLEDWSDDVREAGDRRCQWVDRFTPRGLRAKLARSAAPPSAAHGSSSRSPADRRRPAGIPETGSAASLRGDRSSAGRVLPSRRRGCR